MNVSPKTNLASVAHRYCHSVLLKTLAASGDSRTLCPIFAGDRILRNDLCKLIAVVLMGHKF